MQHQTIRLNDTAFMETYLLHDSSEFNQGRKRPLVVVLPGGGYVFTSDREAEPIALKFNSIGYHSVVVWYTTAPDLVNTVEHAMIEIAQAIKQIREQAQSWLVDPDQIILCGFSAGGSLALQMATRWHQPWLSQAAQTTPDQLRINLAIPCYTGYADRALPLEEKGFGQGHFELAITANERIFGVYQPTQAQIDQQNILNYIDEHTPPMFLWSTFEDQLVDVMMTLKIGEVLHQHNRPFAMHIFQKGEHGLALADRTTARKPSHLNPHVYHWFELCAAWLSDYLDK